MKNLRQNELLRKFFSANIKNCFYILQMLQLPCFGQEEFRDYHQHSRALMRPIHLLHRIKFLFTFFILLTKLLETTGYSYLFDLTLNHSFLFYFTNQSKSNKICLRIYTQILSIHDVSRFSLQYLQNIQTICLMGLNSHKSHFQIIEKNNLQNSSFAKCL